MKQEINLSEFRFNKFSQFSEDGVIHKLFELLNINSGYLIEVGAWDGIYLSNTRYHLENNQNFKSVLIESNTERFADLTKNTTWNDNNILLNVEVQIKGENSLNEILKKYNIDEISLLSIDVDGEDLNLFTSLNTKKHQPSIIIIEFGRWQNYYMLDELQHVFKVSGYNLVHITSNFIFVHEKYNIKAKKNIHELIRISGSPEYSAFFETTEGPQIVVFELNK